MPPSSAPNRTVYRLDRFAWPYSHAWQAQKRLHQQVVNRKLHNRKAEQPLPVEHALLLTEHPAVITLGQNATAENVLLPQGELAAHGIEAHRIERGGDVTYHGPGQLVGYPILDLDAFNPDLHAYLRTLEEVIIQSLAQLGLPGAGRYPGYTGVWLEPETPRARKIAAMGIKCSRWVTYHGFALNLTTDLAPFGYIVPCGIQDKAVTSLAQETGRVVPVAEAAQVVAAQFAALFGAELVPMPAKWQALLDDAPAAP